MQATRIRARSTDVAAKWVVDELVVHDARTDRTHLLDPVTAAVYSRAADGASSEDLVSAVVAAGLVDPAVAEDLLLVALAELERANLLEEGGAEHRPRGMTRRDLLRKGGVAAIAVPAIITITAPPAAANHTGQSCRNLGQSCTTGAHAVPCCSGTCSGGTCCLAAGTTGCTSTAQCCSGICQDSRCCIALNNNGSASTCCSGAIRGNGTCCAQKDQTCTVDSDCCTGQCVGTSGSKKCNK